MATKLYFHAAASTVSGTLPTLFKAGWAITGTESGSSNRTIDTSIGTSQTSIVNNTAANTNLNTQWMGKFVSPTLDVNQTVGGGSITLNCADTESNLNSNFWINNVGIYVWRPSTGTLIGTVRAISTTLNGFGGTETTAAAGEQVTHITGITSSAVSALAGDVVIVEVGSVLQQGMATGYTNTFFYDGTTENTTENATVSNHASYIQLAETLTFGTPGPTRVPRPTSVGHPFIF